MSRRLRVLFTPAEADALSLDGHTAVIVDVLRSTSVIPAALASGAAAVVPFSDPEPARAYRDAHPGTLLCGERDGRALEGFDLGNSPSEYLPDRVRGRVLAFTSTNGMPALLRVHRASRVVTGAFVNEGAVCAALSPSKEPVLLVASGKEGRPSLEDVACCGSLAARLLSTSEGLSPDEGARMAMAVWASWKDDLPGLLAASSHGAELAAMCFAQDLVWCAQRDRLPVLPVLQGERIVC